MNIRCFVAIPMPEPVVELFDYLASGVPGARWVYDEGAHLTLRFAGEVDGLVFRDMDEALRGVAREPFTLSLSGLGHFPPRGEPKVLWAGVSPSDELQRLRHAVDRALGSVGVEPEHRKWVPHVTLARLSGTPSSRLARFLGGNSLFRTEEFTVDHFHLYSSQLHHSGAAYTVEETYPLQSETTA